MSYWIQTFTSKKFLPLAPRPEDIDIKDIAHALSLICRFTGHVKQFYSVAEHSVRVTNRVAQLTGEPEVRQWALLHDASEAYLCDLVRPVKVHPRMSFYRTAEKRLMRAVCERFGLNLQMPPEVKQADNELLFTEARDLLGPPPARWEGVVKPLPKVIEPWTPERAERLFIETFRYVFAE